MPEVTDANILEPGRLADPPPRLLQVREMRALCGPGDDLGVALDTLRPGQNLQRWAVEGDCLGTRLRIAEKKVTLAVVGPAERQDLALAASRQQEKSDNGDLLGREVPAWADSLADRRRISSSDRKRARPLRR